MHLKISQLLTEELRLCKTTLLAPMIPRPLGSYSFSERSFTPGRCWLDPATLRPPLILMAVVSLPHPNPLHPRTRFPTPRHLETMPITMAWPNSVSDPTWVSISQAPSHFWLGGMRHTQATPFPERRGPAEVRGFCSLPHS